MISGTRTKRIRIDITTYKNHKYYPRNGMEEKGNRKCCSKNYHNKECYPGNDMDDKANKKCCSKGRHNNYVCAICLNTRTEGSAGECCKKVPKCCHTCQKSNDCNGKIKERETLLPEKEMFCSMRNKTKDFREKSPDTQHKSSECSEIMKGRLAVEKDNQRRDPNVKTVQTSGTNVAQGLNLLNEVLTVFQNNKADINKEKVKSGLVKDAAVSTTDKHDKKLPKEKPRLSVSTFQYSIDDKKNVIGNNKFTLVNCCQPVYLKAQASLDLIKHKSCSIPQMKLEELKYSLKEKSRSKDAIEEVNRMFATVRKNNKNLDYSNRPLVRSGPRVLPLVKSHPEKNKKDFGTEHSDICKCCQTCMSSGDSFVKNECCHNTDKETCDKCVYMMCCHYEKKHKVQTGMLLCEHCRELNVEQCCQNCMDDSG